MRRSPLWLATLIICRFGVTEVVNMAERTLKNVLSMIALYAVEHKLSPEAVRIIFDTGIGPTQYLRPDLFGSEKPATGEPKSAD